MTGSLLKITDKAIVAAKAKLEKRGTPNAYIRLGVKGGGCSGFTYVIQYEDDKPRKNDIELIFNGLKVLVDNKSMNYLEGTTLDWEKTLMVQGFKFINPNTISTCGCGRSVHIIKK
jgi:iron-sulfur cluster assembly protein